MQVPLTDGGSSPYYGPCLEHGNIHENTQSAYIGAASYATDALVNISAGGTGDAKVEFQRPSRCR